MSKDFVFTSICSHEFTQNKVLANKKVFYSIIIKDGKHGSQVMKWQLLIICLQGRETTHVLYPRCRCTFHVQMDPSQCQTRCPYPWWQKRCYLQKSPWVSHSSTVIGNMFCRIMKMGCFSFFQWFWNFQWVISYTDFDGSFSKLMGLLCMVLCLPNHWSQCQIIPFNSFRS